MPFAKQSAVSVHEEKVYSESGKDRKSHAVRPKGLWTYVQRGYGRTFKGSMDVRPEGLWPYVLRLLSRTSTDPLNGRERE